MSSAYFAPLVTKPVVITEPGEYRTRSGELVTVERTGHRYRHEFGCLGRYASGVRESWHRSGRLYAGIESANDIIERHGPPPLRAES